MRISTLNSQGAVKNRLVYLQNLFSDGTVYLQSTDGGKPASFFLKKQHFPWEIFLPRLLAAWRIGGAVPPAFKLRRRLAPEIIENLEKLSPRELLVAMVALRKSGFLPILQALDGRTCPPEIPLTMVAEFTLKSPNSPQL